MGVLEDVRGGRQPPAPFDGRIPRGRRRGEERDHYLEEALTLAKSLKGAHQASAFRAIVGELARAGEFKQAVNLAKSIGDESYRSLALRAIADELALAEEFEHRLFDEILAEAQRLSDDSYRASAIRAIAEGLARAGKSEAELIEIVRLIPQ